MVAGVEDNLRNNENIRNKVTLLYEAGRSKDLLEYLSRVERFRGDLNIDGRLPSLYNYRGIAFHNSQQLEQAEDSFKRAIKQNKNDTRSWLNLGETQSHMFKLYDSINSFQMAAQLGDKQALSRLIKAKGWSASWNDFERIGSILEKDAITCMKTKVCSSDGAAGLEYTNIPGHIAKHLLKMNPISQDSAFHVPAHKIASLWWKEKDEILNEKTHTHTHTHTHTANRYRKSTTTTTTSSTTTVSSGKSSLLSQTPVEKKFPRLKLGLLSSDFGVHPVATLLRGMIQYIDRDKIELFCFCLVPKVSWWGANISYTAEHFTVLTSRNTQEAAAEIAATGVHILIDLNGHTLHSGLSIMAHKPAPIQMSFLGFPISTAANFIDYYIGWCIGSYWKSTGTALIISEDESFDILCLDEYHEEIPLQSLGVSPDRIAMSAQAMWIDHIYTKTAIDLVLDTSNKNGHTTGLDALWAGVPTVSLGGGSAAESLAAGLGCDAGLAYSLKEYEDIVYSVASDMKRLAAWRGYVERRRDTSSLFDTKTWSYRFTKLMQATWEMAHINEDKTYHIYASTVTDSPHRIQTHQTAQDADKSASATATASSASASSYLSQYGDPNYKQRVVDQSSSRRRRRRRSSTKHISPSSSSSSRRKNRNNGKQSQQQQQQQHQHQQVQSLSKEQHEEETALLHPLPPDLFDDNNVILLNIGGYKNVAGWRNVNSKVLSTSFDECMIF
eukprot:gene7977-16327_t